MIFTYFGLANLYNILGDQQEVKRVCREGMAMVDANADDCSIGAAYIYDVAGGAAYAEGDWKRADSLWTECLKVVTRTRSMDDLGAVFARSYRAQAWYQMNRIDDAEREYRALDPVMRTLFGNSSDMVAGNSLWIGKCALARGDTAQARLFLVESAETHRDFLRANFSYLPDRTTGPADYELALCDWLSGRVREAFDVSLLVEADTRARLRWQARTLSDKDALALEEQRTEGLSLALTALLAGGLDEAATRRAFDAVVRSRAVVLDAVTARHLTARASTDSLARAIGDTLRIVQRQLSAAVVRASNSDEVPGRVGLEQQRRALTSRLSRLEPALARSFEGGSVGADEVALALPSGSRLVSFVRFQRRMEAAGSLVDHRRSEPWYAAFVLGGGEAEVRVHDLGSAAVLNHEIEQWTQAIALATDSNAENAARQPLGDRLRRRMWDVLAPETPEETRIFVVPDGAIASLPILALPTPEGRSQIERSAPLAYLSAERDLVQTSSAREEGVGMLVLADPDFVDARCAEPEEVFASVSRMATVGETDHGEPTPAFRGKTSRCGEFHELYFSRVAQSAAEARDLAVITRQSGMPTGLLLGPEASEESFKRYAPGRRMVHVASHGFALSGRCRTERGGRETSFVRAGIALAGANGRAELDPASNREDGILTAEEVAVLDLSGAECVVLSACESGVGDAITGEGVTGMRRAFHQSGARTLVSSLWKVDDATARAWMREFYRELLGDHPEPADAAHAASLTVLRRLRKGGQEPSPALWGAFVVSGVPEVVSAR